MTVASTTTSIQTPCNGTTTQFNFNNKIFAAADLVVALIDTLGNQYAFTPSGVNTFTNVATGLSYTVYNIDVDTGCFIIFTAAPTNGWTADLRTAIAELQSTSIKNQGSFLPELHEEFFDKATRMLQDLFRRTYTFGIHGPDIEVTPWPALPIAALRKGNALMFDGSTGLPTLGIPSTITYTQGTLGQLLYPQTAAEIAAAVMPVNFIYPPGNILRYGTNTTPGTTDMTTAITKAIAVAMAGGGIVNVPPGIYLYTAQITTAFPAALTDISILGAGANLTEFRCSVASGGLAFTWNTELNTVHIRDIAFTTSVAGGGTALAFNYNSFGSANSLSDVENCVFRGSDGYNVAFFWNNGIVQNDTSALNIDNCTFFGKGTFAAGGTGCSGTGVVVQGISSSNLGVLTNVTRCDFMFLNQGINYGGAVGFYQGLSVATTNFTLCDYGIRQSAGQISDAQLTITGSQFACNFDISLLSGIVGTNIVGNYFISQFTGDVAITIAGTYDFTITGNYFQALSTAANVTAVSINTSAFTFSPAPGTGTTSGTYAAPFIYGAGQAFSIVTSLGQSLRAFFTGFGNANLSWFPAITGSPTTAATLTAGVGVVQGNVIDNYSVGINLSPNTSGVLVTANAFNTPGAVLINNQGPAAVAAFLVPNSVTNNPGFLTRNGGVTGAIATGATVAHGLAVTPTIVTLTQQDGTPTAVFPSAIGATFFTVNYTGGGTHAFAWQASIANVG